MVGLFCGRACLLVVTVQQLFCFLFQIRLRLNPEVRCSQMEWVKAYNAGTKR